MKNITFSIDEDDIEAARAEARRENTTLNEEVRKFLREYGQRAERREQAKRARETIDAISSRIKIDRKFTREEMNER